MIIEELQNALDEIKKNEKETNMIAMLANTLFERTSELQSKLMEAETQLADQQTESSLMQQRYNEMTSELEQKRNQCEKLEMIKLDLDKQNN